MRLAVLMAVFISGFFPECQAQKTFTDSIFDFDETKMGYNSPQQLADSFFVSLQRGEDLMKHFSTRHVFFYMINNAGRKNAGTALAATDAYWDEFVKLRQQYCRQLYDNLIANHIDPGKMHLDSVLFNTEDVAGQEGKLQAANIELIIGFNQKEYSVLLQDCGSVKGKWFVMAPFVFWQGEKSRNGLSSGKNQ